MKIIKATVIIILFSALTTCNCGSSGINANNPAAPLSDKEYNSLSPENQYAVANNLLGSLFKGIPANEFYNLTNSVDPLVVSEGVNLISKTKSSLNTPLENKQAYLDTIESKYDFYEDLFPQEYPLAYFFEVPVSRDYFDYWMAYKLANTILFSPATELESVSVTDSQKVLYRLYRMVRDNVSIRDIVYEHMITQENWRRFRSPEDNTREMMEIFLARFIDAEVPLAAMVCKNWHLTDQAQGYQLVIGIDENTEPQNILDTTVTGCYDFFHAVSRHGNLIPNIVKVLVNHFYTNFSDKDKQIIIDTIAGGRPSTFREIFLQILFSRGYLLRNNRVKWYEEAFFNIAHRIQWIANRGFFQYLVNRSYNGGGLTQWMRQGVMSYKLGRNEVPLDSLSFAYYHKSIREQLLIDRSYNSEDRGWPSSFIDDVDLFGEDFIYYLFLSVLSRGPNTEEMSTLKEVIQERFSGTSDFNSISRTGIAMIVLDYCSRLSELYYMRSLQEEEEEQ